MKKLIFINGPNGVGKSTLCKTLNMKIENSAWLESEWCRMTNPFAFNDEIIKMVEKNISFMLRSYLESSTLEYVIFNHGFHGPRKQIFENVIKNIRDIDYQLIPISITCSYDENKFRMLKDGRDEERIGRALAVRNIYEGLGNPKIDTTDMSVEETACKVLEILKRYQITTE
ncbi:AAA family ATPase [Clostridium sp.]|uniref:AAA family ATPase n=1 Tax=Clostridium sp. TaxID=1506 RepID=UPI002FCC71A8